MPVTQQLEFETIINLITEFQNGRTPQVIGTSQPRIHALKPLESATAEDLSFVRSSSSTRLGQSYLEKAGDSLAAALVVAAPIPALKTTQIIVNDVMRTIAMLAQQFAPQLLTHREIDATAKIHPTAKLGKKIHIGAFSVISENVTIEDDVTIFPHVVIYPGAHIGQGSILHSGVVIREFVILKGDSIIQNGAIIGGDGFGLVPDSSGKLLRIPHIGTVVLESGADVGANSTVDRAMLGETRIGASSKIDNLVMVGHNCELGKSVILCGQVGVSGSVKIGDGSVLGGQAGVADHINIGAGARIAAGTGVHGNVEAQAEIAGYPYMESNLWRKVYATLKTLPELRKRLRRIEDKLFGPTKILLCGFLCASLGLTSACSTKDKSQPAELLKAPSRSEDSLLSDATNYYDRGLFKVSRENWSELRDNYPKGYYAELAEIKMADAYFQSSDYLTALQAYEEFLKLHPQHEAVAYARYQIARCYEEQHQGIKRDRSPLENALTRYQGLIKDFPDTEYAAIAQTRTRGIREKLARAEAIVADFYLRQNQNQAARARYQYLAENYPDTQIAQLALVDAEQRLADFKPQYGLVESDAPAIRQAAATAENDQLAERLRLLARELPTVSKLSQNKTANKVSTSKTTASKKIAAAEQTQLAQNTSSSATSAVSNLSCALPNSNLPGFVVDLTGATGAVEVIEESTQKITLSTDSSRQDQRDCKLNSNSVKVTDTGRGRIVIESNQAFEWLLLEKPRRLVGIINL